MTMRMFIAGVGLALISGCEPVGVDGAAGQEDVEPRAAVARAIVQRSLSRAPENLRMRRLPSGVQVSEIVGGFQHATLVTKSEAGLTRHCLTDADEAVRLLEGRSK